MIMNPQEEQLLELNKHDHINWVLVLQVAYSCKEKFVLQKI